MHVDCWNNIDIVSVINVDSTWKSLTTFSIISVSFFNMDSMSLPNYISTLIHSYFALWVISAGRMISKHESDVWSVWRPKVMARFKVTTHIQTFSLVSSLTFKHKHKVIFSVSFSKYFHKPEKVLNKELIYWKKKLNASLLYFSSLSCFPTSNDLWLLFFFVFICSPSC